MGNYHITFKVHPHAKPGKAPVISKSLRFPTPVSSARLFGSVLRRRAAGALTGLESPSKSSSWIAGSSCRSPLLRHRSPRA